MARRLCAFALAFVIVGAPVAASVCQATCESHDTDAMAGHGHHHSCPPSAPGVGLAMSAVPHTCGHQSDDTVAVQRILQLLTAPAVVAGSAFSFPPADIVAVAARTIDIEQSPPGLLALITQLRV